MCMCYVHCALFMTALLLHLLLLLQVFGLEALSDILTVPVADLAAATQVRSSTSTRGACGLLLHAQRPVA